MYENVNGAKNTPLDPPTNKPSEPGKQCLAFCTMGAGCNRRFVLVAVDYFTKWAEAEALANI